MKSSRLLFIILMSFLNSCQGQNISHRDDGANQVAIGEKVSQLSNSILIVFQSQNGDYWFGSDEDGVYRYDGKSITHYSEKDGLSHRRIRSIQEDKQGNIYFATLGGISKFDGQTLTGLKAIESTDAKDNWKLQPNDLWFAMTGKSGEKGPYRFDGTNLYQLEFPKHYLADQYFAKNPDKPWSPYEVYSIYKDSKGNMWFGTSNFGVCRYDGKVFSWLYEDHLTHVPNGGSFGIRSVIEDKEGKFWICNSNYRYAVSPQSKKESDKLLIQYERQKGIENINSSDGNNSIYFMSAVKDNDGNLWLASYGEGVCCYNGVTAKQFTVKDGAKNVSIFSIYKDKKGGLWLGTHNNGAYRFSGEKFEPFRP